MLASLINMGMPVKDRPKFLECVGLVYSKVVSEKATVAFFTRFKRLYDVEDILDDHLLPTVRQQMIREGLLDGQ